MKKFLIGCLAVAMILGIAGAVGAYYFLWKPGAAMVAEFGKLKEVGKLNQEVRNTEAFVAPSDDLLVKGSLERFLKTQRTIESRLGQRLDELKAKYRMLQGGTAGNATPSPTELFNAYKDLAGVILDTKRAQVAALNENNFSLAEYDWTRRKVYEASGIPVSLEFGEILRDVSEGKKVIRTTPPSAVEQASIPEANRTLVAPHTKELAERAVLAAFGL
jgi:hypothetical protein